MTGSLASHSLLSGPAFSLFSGSLSLSLGLRSESRAGVPSFQGGWHRRAWGLPASADLLSGGSSAAYGACLCALERGCGRRVERRVGIGQRSCLLCGLPHPLKTASCPCNAAFCVQVSEGQPIGCHVLKRLVQGVLACVAAYKPEAHEPLPVLPDRLRVASLRLVPDRLEHGGLIGREKDVIVGGTDLSPAPGVPSPRGVAHLMWQVAIHCRSRSSPVNP
jgi:hypothetical protein